MPISRRLSKAIAYLDSENKRLRAKLMEMDRKQDEMLVAAFDRGFAAGRSDSESRYRYPDTTGK